jgi:hypothetical protein
MTDTPADVPAAFNGTASPALRTADGVAAIAGMLPQMAQGIAGMLAQIHGAIPRPHVCAQCVIARLAWETAHMTEIRKAIAAAAGACGLEEGDPRRAQLDPAPFVPEHLRPGGAQGIPPVNPAITTISGTEYCTAHIPGQPGGRTLLIAQGSLSSSLLSQFSG